MRKESSLLQNIPAGRYIVTETVPDGFVANQPQTVVIEAGKKNVIKFENRFQRGIINLEKKRRCIYRQCQR